MISAVWVLGGTTTEQASTVVTRSGIEVVITSTIGNRVAAETARGFESLPLRQKDERSLMGSLIFLMRRDENPLGFDLVPLSNLLLRGS